MRIIPILTALCAAAALYALVIEREAVLAFARNSFSIGQPELEPAPEMPAVDSMSETASASPVEQNRLAENAVRVIATRSEAEPVEAGITVRGQSESLRFVEVRSQASGIVQSQPLRKGSFVKKDQIICQLDPGTSKANLAEANARLREAEMNERTASRLAEGGFASETQKNSALAALESAAAAQVRANDAIAKLAITAPFDGFLETDAAELGSFLQLGSLCARILQLNPIKFVGYISEIEVENIQLGNVAKVRFLSGRTAKGEVTFISRSADSDTRTFRVEFIVENPELAIRDGSAGEVFVATDRAMAHQIPQSALTLNDAGLLGVRTVDGELARFIPVTVLRDTPKGVWVTGLPPVTDLIVVGQEYVVDGTPVSATYRDRSI
ncbi:MAG: efflux RND transporter periplasmic adaptor subunit [Rhodobacteraceae bacterium]|nr:efflux RND transporter periplasmic adaptor subunit [Paracoccaceae bacterium]